MMKRKIIYWIVGIILIGLAGYYYALPLALSKILTAGPRSPKLQYPVTYEIGWWSYQNGLKVESFDIEMVESKLSLFNSKSLISYSISGSVSYKNNWRPFIEEIHISQRLLPIVDNDSTFSSEAIIEITPVVDIKEDDSYNGESIKFELTNEMIVNSLHWGNNQITFKCFGITKDIEFAQRK